MRDFLEALPKIELHVHVEGTIAHATKTRLAAANGVALKFPTMESIAEAHAASGTDPAGALRVFLDIYYDGLSVLFTEDDFHAVTLEFLTNTAARNVRHVDLSFDPQAHTIRGVPIEAVMNGLIAGVEQAQRECGITTALVMCINRDKSVDSAYAALDQAAPWRERIAGLGLDSNEAGNPPEKFVDIYARARSEGYRLTAHCDVDQTNAVEHIRRCVDCLKVERIDHGMNVIEDEALVRHCMERNISFTACPTWRAHDAMPRRLERLRQMLDAGLRVSINSDDPTLLASGTLADMLDGVATHGPFDRQEMTMFMRHAAKGAFVDPSRQMELLGEIDAFASANRAPAWQDETV